MKWDSRPEALGKARDAVVGLDSKPELLQRKIKRKYWKTKEIVKSSKIFRLSLLKKVQS